MSNRQQRRLQQKNLRKKKGASASPAIISRENLASAMQAAVQYHHDSKYREAENIYRQVLDVDPEHLDALNSMAMIDYKAKRYKKALVLLKKVEERSGDNAGVYMNLGAVQDAAGMPEDAEHSYRRSIELMPTYTDPYHNLGDLYLRQHRAEEAVQVFDDCMSVVGREFHSLAYKAHALDDAGRHDEARYLLDFDTYVRPYRFEAPQGFESLEAFNDALARHIKTHPTLRGDVMSTENGKHTGELLRDPKGPMGPMEGRINEAIRWYISELPDDPDHPAVKWAPKQWKLTSWGVVMHNQGHERAHIHPNGWLSAVFYLHLPDLIDDPDRAPEGWLEFGRPTPEMRVQSDLTIRHYKPEYGQMFLFPSYMYHGTIPFKSDQRRICVAFDVEPLY